MFNFFKKKNVVSDNSETAENKEEKNDVKKFDDIEIHSMPKKFKREVVGGSSQTKTLGLSIMIGGGIVLVAASAFLFWYIYNSGGDKVISQPEDTTLPEVVENIAPTEEQLVEEKINEPEIITEQGCGSSSAISAVLANMEEFNYEDEAVLTCLGESIGDDCKIATSTLNIENIGEVQFDILGKRGTKCVTKITYPLIISETELSIYNSSSMQCFYDLGELNNFGYEPAKLAYYTYQQSSLQNLSEENNYCLGTTIDLWRQQQAQKLLEESNEQVSNFKSGIDSDGDGLTDVEENTVFVTDSSKVDTDLDGYSDYEEVLNLYNPAGSGQLADSGLVLRYNSNVYSYSVLYPKDWQREEKVDSIFFSSGVGGLIQVLVQDNNENKTLKSWYMDLTGETEVIQQNTEETKNGFEVIYSTDKLTAYLVPIDGSDKIFVLTYSPENSESLEFLTVLNMMVKSFK